MLTFTSVRDFNPSSPLHLRAQKELIVETDHCIESLRELIMCEGNMTPIPLEWSEKGERLNPNYASKHTCRDFVKLKEWMMERSKKGV